MRKYKDNQDNLNELINEGILYKNKSGFYKLNPKLNLNDKTNYLKNKIMNSDLYPDTINEDILIKDPKLLILLIRKNLLNKPQSDEIICSLPGCNNLVKIIDNKNFSFYCSDCSKNKKELIKQISQSKKSKTMKNKNQKRQEIQENLKKALSLSEDQQKELLIKEIKDKFFDKNGGYISLHDKTFKSLLNEDDIFDSNEYIKFQLSIKLFKSLDIFPVDKINTVGEFIEVSLSDNPKDLICPIENCTNLKEFKTKGEFFSTCREHKEFRKEEANKIISEKNGKIMKNLYSSDEFKKFTMDKMRNTMLKKYGATRYIQSKEFKGKMVEKYGAEYYTQSKEFKEKLPEIQNKIKRTNTEKYGEPWFPQSKEYKDNIDYIQEKMVKTTQERYGVQWFTQSEYYQEKLPEIRDKFKETMLEKYGSTYYTQSQEYQERLPEIQKKIVKTTKERYGVQWYPEHEEFHEKYQRTSINNYGVPHYFQSQEYQEKLPEFLEKTKEKNLEKYGVEYYTQSQEYQERLPEIQKKQQQTLRKNYGVQWTEDKIKIPMTLYNPEKYFKNINFILSINQIKSHSQSHMENLHLLTKEFIEDKFLNKDNNFMIQDFCNFFNCKETIAYIYLKKFGVEYNKYQGTSSPEYQIIDFIKNDLSVDKDKIIHGDRKTIVPLEIDILIKDHNLAIEYNGLYWHSYSPFNNLSDKQSDLNYQRSRHLNKTIACENKGINLLHIFENEWLDPKKQDIWKSVIGYKLGITKEKHYARKLKVQKIESKEAKAFFEENHLQGGQAPGSIAYGLFKDNELISCMTFGKSRFNKRYDYELIRFASKKYTSCVGCAKRLFKAFVKEYNPTSIISYANRRWASSLSNLYKAIGFKELEAANPNYFYFKINQKEITLKSRNVFQKHKLKDHPDTKDFYDKNKTESQIMSEAGFRRIYDAGNLVYLWKRD